MNDEIKEILEFKENADYKKLSCDEIKVLKDYIHNLWRNNWGNEVKATNQKIKIKELEKRIVKLKDNITNLQQENERLKLELSGYREAILRNDKLLGLQQRIEKAVEYIKEMDTQLEVYGDYDILSDNKNDLLNILNGDNNE